MLVLPCRNGIGDRILDIIGLSIFAECYKKRYYPIFNFNNQMNFGWQTHLGGSGVYDTRLFHWGHLHVPFIPKKRRFPEGRKVFIPDPSMTLSPIGLLRFTNLPFESIIQKFREAAMNLKPVEIIENILPKELENCYGIHLRKTDKVVSYTNSHMCNKNEFDQIMQKLQEYVLQIINENPNAQFFICSEDENWKNIISQWIITQKGNIVTLNIPPNMYNNIPGFFAITDLFALSRCKEIIQGVKHSSFSLLASLINPNGKIVNFASPEDTLLQYWTYVVNTNHPLQALQQLFTKMNKFKTVSFL